MAESNRDRINPSLLDRLTDEGSGRGVSTTVSELRKSVLRDLAWLFNTTRPFTPEQIEERPQVRNSVLNYGMPPLSGITASGLNIRELERSLRQAIIDFEPRILPDSVSVKALAEGDTVDHHNVIALHIEGLLWAQPVPIELLLRTQFDLESGQSRVEETTAGRR